MTASMFAYVAIDEVPAGDPFEVVSATVECMTLILFYRARAEAWKRPSK